MIEPVDQRGIEIDALFAVRVLLLVRPEDFDPRLDGGSSPSPQGTPAEVARKIPGALS